MSTIENAPDVPRQLVERIEKYRNGQLRIDVLEQRGTGWRKIDELAVERTTPRDPLKLATRAYALAKDHATRRGAGGKYRALIWRKISELENGTATFPVETELERRQRFRDRRALIRSNRRVRNLQDAQRHFSEFVADTNERMLDQMLEMDRIRAQRTVALRASLMELMELYEAGLRMQDQVSRGLG